MEAVTGQVITPRKFAKLSELVRTYIVYTMCQSETLVDHSPGVLALLTGIPGVRQVTEALVRVTFFNQVHIFLDSLSMS